MKKRNMYSPVIFRHFSKFFWSRNLSPTGSKLFFELFRKVNAPTASKALDNINAAPRYYTRPPRHKG
jgi:hypothetical protein